MKCEVPIIYLKFKMIKESNLGVTCLSISGECWQKSFSENNSQTEKICLKNISV